MSSFGSLMTLEVPVKGNQEGSSATYDDLVCQSYYCFIGMGGFQSQAHVSKPVLPHESLFSLRGMLRAAPLIVWLRTETIWAVGCGSRYAAFPVPSEPSLGSQHQLVK